VCVRVTYRDEEEGSGWVELDPLNHSLNTPKWFLSQDIVSLHFSSHLGPPLGELVDHNSSIALWELTSVRQDK
jgi:hypothetical protein